MIRAGTMKAGSRCDDYRLAEHGVRHFLSSFGMWSRNLNPSLSLNLPPLVVMREEVVIDTDPPHGLSNHEVKTGLVLPCPTMVD